ncbi:hypothetical protein [Pantoea sp. KPR_PJ]|uniref:hypothetical protein n=1 Tax=Pantoea sp. KPR_PJ TaxID=2738375 RepID=UPI0035295286
MMKKLLRLTLIACVFSGCSDNSNKVNNTQSGAGRVMPDIFQPVTPSQQRAIMSGERPDWTEDPPVRLPRHQR